jgi:hypothetical protein
VELIIMQVAAVELVEAQTAVETAAVVQVQFLILVREFQAQLEQLILAVAAVGHAILMALLVVQEL